MEEADRRLLSKLYDLIEEFRKIDAEMQAQQMQAFLITALGPAISVKDVAQRLGIASGTASRNVAILSSHRGKGVEGHGLIVAKEKIEDRRAKELSLTAAGRRVTASMLAILKR